MTVSETSHHIIPMDMYAITAFGKIINYTSSKKIELLMNLNGFRKYDYLLREMDKTEFEIQGREYKEIKNRETTTVQKVRQTVGNFGILGVVGAFFTAPLLPIFPAALPIWATVTVSSMVSLMVAGPADNNNKFTNGVSYTDRPRYNRLMEKIQVLERSLQLHDKSGLSYKQQEKAQKFFDNVVKEYDVYHQ